MNASYPMRVIIAIDLCANVILGGKFGETISARVGMHHKWYERITADFLNAIQPGHTTNARHNDEIRDIEALRDLEGENE